MTNKEALVVENYDDIMNMTDEQAADILENLRVRLYGGRQNGKTKLSLAYNVATEKAIKKLRGQS